MKDKTIKLGLILLVALSFFTCNRLVSQVIYRDGNKKMYYYSDSIVGSIIIEYWSRKEVFEYGGDDVHILLEYLIDEYILNINMRKNKRKSLKMVKKCIKIYNYGNKN